MFAVRYGEERGRAELGWLDGRHSFSFADYYDPKFMGFRALRVINEDRIAPGGGFPTHPHRDMEIVTYMLDGALEHRDTLDNHAVIRAGEVQRMTAGTGIRHSEMNAGGETAHLLQIWLLPEAPGLKPGYEQQFIPVEEKRGRLRAVATRDGRDGSMIIHQDAGVYATVLGQGESLTQPIAPGRHIWVQVARGSMTANGQPLNAGDAIALWEEATLELTGTGTGDVLAEAVVFDLA